MKAFYTTLAICLLGFSSQDSIQGTYQSYCTLHHVPESQLIVNSNNTFAYKFIYNGDKIEGTWVVNQDTLILKSDYFIYKGKEDSLAKIRKLTDWQKDQDIYLIKGKKLFPVMKNGSGKTCALIKTEKPVRIP